MLQHTSCIINASRHSQTTWNTVAPSDGKQRNSPCPCLSSGHKDKIWLRGTDGLRKILSVTTLFTNLLQLPLINKEPVGVAAQGKPQAIFQLVSPERQIGILHSALREESENKTRGGLGGGGGVREDKTGLCWRACCKGRERVRRQAKRRTVKDVEAAIFSPGWVD